MTPKNKRTLIIVGPIIALAIIILVIVILYLTTDFLKSKKDLFLKYMSQNVDAAKIVIDNKSEKEYSNLLKQNKNESKMEINATYTENINTSQENKNNDLNKLKLSIDSQSEYMNNYEYKDIRLIYNNASMIRTEYIKENEKYGLRFPERFNQFLTVENQNLKQIATQAGFSEELTEIIPENIQEYDINNVFSLSDEEIETLKNRYSNVIKNNIPKNKYSKQKDALITIGEQSINSTAYSITLTQEEANDIYIKLLEELKEDDIIKNKLSQMEPLSSIFNLIKQDERAYNLSNLEEECTRLIEEKINYIQQNNIGTSEVKFTVYQTKGNTVRTQISEEARQITLDFDITDTNNINVNIQNKNINQEKENESNTKIIKTNDGEGNKFSIKFEKTLGDDISQIEFYRNKKINDSDATINTGISYNDGNDNLLEITSDENVTINQDFTRKIELDEVNSVIANDYDESLISKWTNQVKEYLEQVRTKNQSVFANISKISFFKDVFGLPEEVVQTEPTETTEVEKNRFNAKFEFYTGKEKKKEDIVKLLEETKNCLKGAQVAYSNEGNTEGTKKLESIKLEVEDGSNKEELAESIKDMLEESKTYTVEVEKNSNDLIVTVNITVNK